jgi:GT2 family glycosyltransferase
MTTGVDIIIVNWNTERLLFDCLASLYEHINPQLPPGWELCVTVVDNASVDGSVEMVKQKFPQIRLIINQENLGFAAANNLAFASSAMSYFLLLNSDTLVKENSFKAIFEFALSHSQAGVVAPCLYNGDGSVQVYPWVFPSPLANFANLLELYRFRSLYDKLFPDQFSTDAITAPKSVDKVSGACMLVKQEVYEQIGGLDANFFFYSEEVDWCYRIKQMGWQVWFVPMAAVVHLGGQSSKKVPYQQVVWFHEGYLRFYRKHYSFVHYMLHSLAMRLATLVKIVVLLGLLPFSSPEKRQHRLKLLGSFWRILLSKAKL